MYVAKLELLGIAELDEKTSAELELLGSELDEETASELELCSISGNTEYLLLLGSSGLLRSIWSQDMKITMPAANAISAKNVLRGKDTI